MFVDALDEHEGDHEDIATFLKSLLSFSGNGNTFLTIIVSSREETIFTDQFRHLTTGQSLQIHDWTRDDIEVYVRNRFSEQSAIGAFMNSDDRQETQELMSSIVHRAQGVFL